MLQIVIHGIKRNNGEYRTLNKCNFMRKEDAYISFFKTHFRSKNLKNKTMGKKPLRLKIASFDNRVLPLSLRYDVKCNLEELSCVFDVPPISFIKRALYDD